MTVLDRTGLPAKLAAGTVGRLALPQKILQVHNRYRQGGGEDTVVSAQRTLLIGAGCDVRLIDARNADGAIRAMIQLLAASWNPATAIRVRARLGTWQPDVAHVHNTWFALSPSVISALHSRRIPVVMTLHNYRLACINAQLLRGGQPCQLCVGTHPLRGVQYRCYRGSYLASFAAATSLTVNRHLGTWERGVDRFLALTHFQRSLMAQAGLDPERIDVVSNFVDEPGPRIVEPHASDMVLYVGRLAADKGVDKLIEAWLRVMPSNLRLVVVGDGPLRTQLEGRIVPGIEFAGRVSPAEVKGMMLSARALVFPTAWYEGQPMVLLEAMAAGLPIVAPQMGGVKDTLGDAAYWAGSSWEATLSNAAALSDTQLADLGRLARTRYLQEFTPERSLSRLAEVYKRAREGYEAML